MFFFRDKELPRQIAPDTPELGDRKLQDFFLRMNHVYSEGFFARKVMLIEGTSDLLMCRYLCNRFDLNLDVAGTQIIPVEGKGQFPVITKLFRLIGKDVCLLTDLDGFTDDNSVVNLFSKLPEATEIANKHGNADLQTMIRDIKTKLEALIQKNKEMLGDIYKNHPYWTNHDPEKEEDVIICRALVAQLFTINDEEILAWPDSQEWKSLKIRVAILLDILGELGCFVLRKGAIESYYLFAPNTTFNGKPSAAAIEISGLQEKSEDEIGEQYADLVRSLEYAALDKKVDESFAVKKELLSELALVLGILGEISTEKDLYSAIKQAKGSSESLFKYTIIEENTHKGVEISMSSKVIDVEGFPFKVFVGDNVNTVVEANVQQKR